ncbi:MAG: hypothetical protein HY219_03065 [Candidatus Staskawiczbacteria bacterium]|nr:hypothetical protein [Candidatus Staskawiczbacteria bacterium]
MNETKKIQTNRCFVNSSLETPKQQPDDRQKRKEQKIKEAISSATQRKKIHKQIDLLLEMWRGKRIIDLLPVIKLRYPHLLDVALERAKKKQYEIGSKDAIFLAEFEASLKKPE